LHKDLVRPITNATTSNIAYTIIDAENIYKTKEKKLPRIPLNIRATLEEIKKTRVL
jgi:hypothetical protein